MFLFTHTRFKQRWLLRVVWSTLIFSKGEYNPCAVMSKLLNFLYPTAPTARIANLASFRNHLSFTALLHLQSGIACSLARVHALRRPPQRTPGMALVRVHAKAYYVKDH